MATKICVFNPITNLIDVTDGVASFTGSNVANAGAPVVLNSSGALDSSFLNSNPVLVLAAMALPAGSLVNLYYTTIGGITAVYAQLANAASTVNLPAMGYVNVAYSAGQTVTVLTSGLVSVPFTTGFSPSDIGQTVYLSPTVPGGVTLTLPVNPNLIQPLGFVYQVGGSSNSYVQFPFESFPLATVNQTPIATNTQVGVVKPDATTISVNGSGVITAITATATTVGVSHPDGVSITINNGILSVPTASTTALGLVKPDGTTVVIANGTISASGFLPLTGGTILGSLIVVGGITIQGAPSNSFIKADGTGAAILSSSYLSDNSLIVKGNGTGGYVALFTGPDSPPFSPPSSTNMIGDSHLDDGVTQAGTITSSEPLVVQGDITASMWVPYIIYSQSLHPLPPPGPSLQGVQAVVSDAASPSYMAPYVGGGTVTCSVICSFDGLASPPAYLWMTH